MSNDTQAPNVNIGEQNVPENLAEQSGLPNMSSTKVFKVETDMLVLGDVYADNFIGRGAAGGTYATQVGFNPEDPLDTASVVLDAGTDGTDSLLTVKTIITDGTVDFTGATLIGIPDLVGISLTDLSVSVDPAGVANLEYDNTTGVFTYTPPDLSSYLTASSTDTLTNKSGSNSQWTNDEGYTTNVGTVTPDSTDTFTNKSGSNSQWTNDEGYTTNVGTTTADNVQTFTNKSGSNSQWTNDEGYIDLTDLSVSVATEGTANLSYDNISGVFTYTPPSLDGYLPLSGGTLTAPLYFEDGGITVGGIGTNGGRLSIGSGDVNLNFNASANSIYPISDTAGTLSDAIVDIGASNARFKDLYLAGTATMDGLTVDTAAPFMSFKESGATKLFIGESSAVGGGAGYYDFYAVTGLGQRFFTNSVERLRIDSAGNVGIGTTVASSMNAGANQLVVGSGSTGQGITLYSSASTAGSIHFADGTSGNEAYRGQLVYNHNGDYMAMLTAATERMRIDSSGNVGIGTTNPDTSLHVTTPSGTKTELNLAQTAVTNYRLSIPASTDALTFVYGANTERMRIDSSGNVGIGTSSPASPTGFGTGGILHLKGSTGNDCSIVLEGLSGSGGRQEIGASGGALQFYRGAATGSMTESMRIDASGNLLVGKTTTAIGTQGIRLEGNNGKIEATRSGNVVTAFNRTGSDGTISEWMKDGTTVGSIGTNVGRLSIGSGDTGVLFAGDIDAIYPANGIAARDSAIDLGASSARFKDLCLSGTVALTTADNASAANMFVSPSTDFLYLEHPSNGMIFRNTAGSERMRIDASGNVLINNSTGAGGTPPNSGFVLETGGNIKFRVSSNGSAASQYYNASGTIVGSVVVNATTTAYNTSSDQRLKDNIVDADDAGSKIDAIQVRQYDWKADGSHQDYGMIAQELQLVAPEAVSGDADSEEMMGVDYSKLVPMLVKEIQSLRNRVAQLEE